jgi:isopentenyl-diphosphate delta-isomerase
MSRLYQLYNELGVAVAGKGSARDDVFREGLLHSASHVWIWRDNNGVTEILLQKRATRMPTWPNRYDISAAGHIDLGEEPLIAAIREAKEEIGLDVTEDQLQLFGVHRTYLVTENDLIENEFQWLYLLRLFEEVEFSLQASELESLEWVSLDTFKVDCLGKTYVPHGKIYYDTVLAAIERMATK